MTPTVDFLHRAGASVERVLAKADLPAWIASDGDMLVPSSSSTRLRGAAARFLGMPTLGLTIGERTAVEPPGLLGLVRRASTLDAALEAAVRCSPLLSSRGRMRIRRRGDRVEVARFLTPSLDPRDFASQQTDQFILGLMIGLVRLAAGPSWRPDEVHLQTDEAPALRDAESLAGTRVAFRQPATMIAIPRALLAAPLPPPARIEEPADVIEGWKSSAPARDFVASIRQAVETLSCRDYPDVRMTADFVGISVRTLQRRLGEAGVSHHLLVAQARFATAAAVLERTDAKILDLALDLGYCDHANFTRAFRRWAGCSPREYRIRHARRRCVANPFADGRSRGGPAA